MKRFALVLWLLAMFFSFGCTANGGGSTVDINSNTGTRTDVTRGPSLPHVKRDGGADETSVDEELDGQNQVEGPYFYFSYDDSGSTAAHDLTQFYIEQGLSPDASWGRAYEYLNAEKFSHFAPMELGPFDVSMGLYRADTTLFPAGSSSGELENTYSLGVNVSGPQLSNAERPNIVATFLIDVSGSMSTPYAPETRNDLVSLLDVAKYGLSRMRHALKEGDVINLVSFSSSADLVLEDWHYDQSKLTEFESIVDTLATQSSTNLNGGIQLAYRVAQRTFDPEKSNRVILLTDAYANAGEVSPTTIAENTVINGLEGINFAGVGIGNTFDERFLNELTDIGKGNYTAMITPEDAERIFVSQFASFVDSAVSEVRFRLDYPESFKHLIAASAAEEVSADEQQVQTTNFAYNTQQFFLEQFTSSEIDAGGSFRLSVTYKGKSGAELIQSITLDMNEILGAGRESILSASMAYVLAGLVSGSMACEDVIASDVFSLNVEHPIYLKYQSLVQMLCNQ